VVFANVWEKVNDEYLREFSYMAECANLNFSLTVLNDSINMEWAGFNDSMPSYIDETLTRIKKMTTETDLKDIFD